MRQDFIIQELDRVFGKRVFTREELFDFLKRYDPYLKETTFRWQIYNLKQNNHIMAHSKNEFSRQVKPKLAPSLGKAERRIYKELQKDFAQAATCIWNTGIILEFMLHQPASPLIIVEVETDAIKHVYDRLIEDSNSMFAGLQFPTGVHPYYLANKQREHIYVKPLISRAPIQLIDKIPTITLEKLCVDLFCEPEFYSAFAGSELAHIFNNMYNRYAMDFTKLFQYASRRAKADQLRQFLQDSTDIPQNLLKCGYSK